MWIDFEGNLVNPYAEYKKYEIPSVESPSTCGESLKYSMPAFLKNILAYFLK